MSTIQQDPAHFAPPGGESLHDVEQRMMRFIVGEVLPRVELDGPSGIIVTHGLAIKW